MRRARAAMLGLLLAGLPAAAWAETARAELKDAQGKVVGTAVLSEVAGGVRIALKARGLTPGDHGFHLHAVGTCEPPAFTSAGGHFNPQNKKHGHKNPEGAHAGDLPNLRVASDGTGSLEAIAAGVTLKDAVGLALVIHADADDEKTDPTGNAGARVACGVITK
jgi:superoxide dismutase, Cu-Zn family